jgi:ABC-type glutathione transport system ATPase component
VAEAATSPAADEHVDQAPAASQPDRSEPDPAAEAGGDITVLVRDLHVRYRVYEDRRPRVREILAKGFKRPSYREIHAVRGVDLTARQGEAIGMVGHNGSGKSTSCRPSPGCSRRPRGRSTRAASRACSA